MEEVIKIAVNSGIGSFISGVMVTCTGGAWSDVLAFWG